mmetsp:Transcript_33555/g.53735  ORF Transcript_33555/g.53735 Transcript_33555/m.53735 type:complete len:232 (-) Transcript_33555:196-891(-)
MLSARITRLYITKPDSKPIKVPFSRRFEMNEQIRIILTRQRFAPRMSTFGRFIKHSLSRLHSEFMQHSLMIVDLQRPILAFIHLTIHIDNGRDNMRGARIHMHGEHCIAFILPDAVQTGHLQLLWVIAEATPFRQHSLEIILQNRSLSVLQMCHKRRTRILVQHRSRVSFSFECVCRLLFFPEIQHRLVHFIWQCDFFEANLREIRHDLRLHKVQCLALSCPKLVCPVYHF